MLISVLLPKANAPTEGNTNHDLMELLIWIDYIQNVRYYGACFLAEPRSEYDVMVLDIISSHFFGCYRRLVWLLNSCSGN
jgi:hypothetical protein